LAQIFIILSVGLLVMTLLRGETINQASRWLKVPGTSIQFQTSDFAKFALIVFVARYLSRNQTDIKDFRKGFLPVIVIILGMCGLILPANLSTAAILFASCLILLFIGRVRLLYLLGLIGLGVAMLAIFMVLAKNAPDEGRTNTWKNRITNFVDPGGGDNFQTDKAKIAIANGGVLGKFAGHSTQRHSLPQAYSDFIFAIIIEEYGLLFGALPLVFLYLILLFRAGVIVRKCDRTFPAFLVIGLTIGVVVQAIVNMGVAVGLFPVTGQPLPWVSRGGTSILFTAVVFGIILGISRTLDSASSNET